MLRARFHRLSDRRGGAFCGADRPHFLIATPTSWYAMHQWLEGFTYRTNLDGWLFAAAEGMAVLIAVATVIFQMLRAALANPVKSLRTE